ncbi:MAG: hypothetical protein ABIJ16_08780 [Bacteroidota bacterium]
MKRIFYLLVLAPFFFFSCQEGENPELADANTKADSLQSLLNERDQTVNEFFESFNQIEENLAMIKEKENLITVSTSGGSELSPDAKDRINDDILAIYELLQKNKSKIAYLNKKMKESDLQILELNKMIERLTMQIQEKDNEMTKLREELMVLNILVEDLAANIDSLTNENLNQEETINDQDAQLHTAFYVVGTSRELKEQEIITKEGGFVGIGKVEKLMEDFNKDYFTKIDYRNTTKIPLMVKKAKLVTTHPSDSYVFDGPEGKVDNLVITNAEKFWSTSKYAVIVVE